MATHPHVTIFVLNWNRRHLLVECLAMLLGQTYDKLRVVVIDNASVDGSAAMVAEQFPQVGLIENAENLGFGRGMNAGLRTVTDFSADHLIMLFNNDVAVEPKWLSQMVAAWQSTDNVGVAGCTLYDGDDVVHVGGQLDHSTAYSQHFTTVPDEAVIDVDFVTGAAFMFSAETLHQIGLLDDIFSPLYYEEVDFCYRVRALGQRIVVFPQIVGDHAESTSVNSVRGLKAKSVERSRLKFVLKHYSADEFTNIFLPTEHARLQQSQQARQLQLLRQALTEVIVKAPTLLASWGRSAELSVFLAGFLQLRDLTLPRGLPSPYPRYDEYQFKQTLVGRLRTIWHAVAGKWALRHTQQRQQRINAELVDALHAQSTADELQYLLERFAELEQRLRRLEAEDKTPHPSPLPKERGQEGA